MASLIQDRIAIDRLRVAGLWMLIPGGLGFVAGAVSLVGGAQTFRLFPMVVFAIAAILGVLRLVQARLRRVAFETLHGKDAGKQQPVR